MDSFKKHLSIAEQQAAKDKKEADKKAAKAEKVKAAEAKKVPEAIADPNKVCPAPPPPTSLRTCPPSRLSGPFSPSSCLVAPCAAPGVDSLSLDGRCAFCDDNDDGFALTGRHAD